jgi:hypothetical protein
MDDLARRQSSGMLRSLGVRAHLSGSFGPRYARWPALSAFRHTGPAVPRRKESTTVASRLYPGQVVNF